MKYIVSEAAVDIMLDDVESHSDMGGHWWKRRLRRQIKFKQCNLPHLNLQPAFAPCPGINAA